MASHERTIAQLHMHYHSVHKQVNCTTSVIALGSLHILAQFSNVQCNDLGWPYQGPGLFSGSAMLSPLYCAGKQNSLERLLKAQSRLKPRR